MTEQESAPTDNERVIDRRRLIKDASRLAGGAVAASVLVPELASAGAATVNSPTVVLTQATPTGSPVPSPIATPAASPLATPVDLESYVAVNLTSAELTTLKAALDRIIPNDELGPGANEAGVFVYIDRALGGRSAASLPLYQKGFAALDTAAGSGGFAALSADKQDEILKTAESGDLAGDPGGFFATLLSDTRVGMFADPVHGGNVNFAGWDLMGYPGVKLVWSAEDQGVNSTPKPEHISVAQFGGSA